MQHRIYYLENLDCANCAAKIEAKFNAHPQVETAVIVFPTRQLQLTAENPDALVPELQALARTVESEVSIVAHEHHHHTQSCECGHCHTHAPFWDEKKTLGVGAGLFGLGLVLGALSLEIGSILLFLAAYALLGWEILVKAVKNIGKGQIFDENFLMGIATLGALIIGEYPEAVGIMLFYRLGEYFEEKATQRSRSQIMEAVDLRPEVVNLLQGEEISVISAREAKVGDVLLVRPGDRIPLDGTVVFGESRLDTAPITGEPMPVAVKPGEQVLSGCVNLSGLLHLRVEKVLEESMVSRILRSVETAAATKPKIDRFITRFAGIYTPIVVALAVVTAVVPSLLDGNWNYWVYTALSFLVMSCPCALVLSVPLAFFSGIGTGGKQGILFKGGMSMEALARVKAVALDKTGTLTDGSFCVREVRGGEEILRLCGAVEKSSNHPIAVSVVQEAERRGLSLPQAQQVEEIPGHGMLALVEGKKILCGNEKLLKKFDITLPAGAQSSVGALVYVAVDGEVAGSILVSDEEKEDAYQAVSKLKESGCTVAMLTGDRRDTAEQVAEKLGIEKVYAGLLPEEKLHRVQALRTQFGPTLFVGDGMNDAPVLAGADVGAAMGSGADAALEAADVVFMTSRMSAVPEAIAIARRTKAIAWQNVIFALGIKGIVMILGLLGYASMWAAVFADSGVAMLCVLNSVRLLYGNKNKM